MPLSQALDLIHPRPNRIGEAIEKIQNETQILFLFPQLLFSRQQQCFKEAIKTGEIPNKKVKGIVGYGAFSKAFLTSDYKVLKLSTDPLFPSEADFIKDVDVPIYKSYIAHLNNGEKVYGALEAFAESAVVRFDLSKLKNIAEYQRNWDILNDILWAKTNYEFDYDFGEGIPLFAKQMGFIGDKPYLLDHQSVLGRPLMT